MIETDKLCFCCMGHIENGVCTKCGNSNATYKKQSNHLNAGTILNGKYLVGEAIGEGGFGITYIGFDIKLEMKVAIKEFFPVKLSNRDTYDNNVTVSADTDKYNRRKEQFLEEARSLAKLDVLPGVVSVKDFFEENNTAYIVMEYVEGETLENFIRRSGGRMPSNAIIQMMKPVVAALIQIHKRGIIHRDISPDNIMITSYSGAKLIDLGSSYNIGDTKDNVSALQLKPGYAPEEQYRVNGQQGPWTDVYALCATIYRAVTGNIPLPSINRVNNDTLMKPSRLGVAISAQLENTIMGGMGVFAQNRIQSMNELYDNLYGNNKSEKQDSNHQKNSDSSKKLVVLMCVLGAIVVVMSIMIIAFVIGKTTDDSLPQAVNVTAVPTYTPSPTLPPKPEFSSVSASSTRGADHTAGYEINYFASYINDGDVTTAWSCDRNTELTPTIIFSSPTKQHVTGLKMANGYFKSEQTYTRNRRITEVLISFDGGSKKVSLKKDSYREMQDILLDNPVDTTFLSIKVLDTVYGDWKDIAISEVSIY